MLKSFRGDTLVYTKLGTKRIDNIKEEDEVLTKNGDYKKVLALIKDLNKKLLFKVKLHNNIDNFMLTKYAQLLSITNIPYDIDNKDIISFIENTNSNCYINYNNISELSDFDYVAYTIPTFNEKESEYNSEFYRYYGILFYFNFNNILKFDINKNKDTINFIKNYLTNNDISFKEISSDESISYNINHNYKKFNIDYCDLNKECTLELLKGFIELSIVQDNKPFIYYKTINKSVIYIIKFLLLKLGILISTFYKDQNNIAFYFIRIPKTEIICSLFNLNYNPEHINSFNYFIYKNYIWTKIKGISNIDYKGPVYMLSLEDDCTEYLTDIGITNNIIKYN